MSDSRSLRHDAPLNAPDRSPGVFRADANEGAFLGIVPLPVHGPRKAALMAPHQTIHRILRLVDIFGTEEDSAFRRPLDETRVAVPIDRIQLTERPGQGGPAT